MLINGKMKTKNGRVMDFQFKTEQLGRVVGSFTCWSDNTYSVKSLLSINGKDLDMYYTDNLVNTELFKDMFKDSTVEEITNITLDKYDTRIIAENVSENVQSDSDFEKWFLNEYNLENSLPETIGDNLNYIIEEYIWGSDDFHYLLTCCYELSNNYHCLSQWNMYLESIFDRLYSEYEEDLAENQEIA